PVSAERAAALASRSALSAALVKTMVRDTVMGTPEPSATLKSTTIVAFVTYGGEDATPSQQHWGNSNLAAFGRRALALPPAAPMLGLPYLGNLIRRPGTRCRWRSGLQASDTMIYWRARGGNCSVPAMPSCRCPPC